MRLLCSAPLLTLCLACKPAAPPAVASEPAPRYYLGTTTTTSPDGATAYGPPFPVAVRRTLDPRRGTIDEYVVHPGSTHPTHLRRDPGAGPQAIFTAEDDQRSFTGTITFTGPDWAWTAWTYAITLSDGSGTLRGSGRADARSITTDKLFHGPDGQPRARIRERLDEVDLPTFTRTRDELLRQPAP